jgi:hypothetical protein
LCGTVSLKIDLIVARAALILLWEKNSLFEAGNGFGDKGPQRAGADNHQIVQ